MSGLYIHVPFCVHKCDYCDFYSVTRLGSVGAYVHAVLTEAKQYARTSFQTLYIGGGTPSLLGAHNLTGLIAGLRQNVDMSSLEEASIEANPDSCDRQFLEAARDAGIDRLSLGVQSLNDEELRSVGRVHNARQAVGAVELAGSLGFPSISADLIVGLPGQTWETLHESLIGVTQLGVKHISVYCLALEEGTPLAEAPPSSLPSDDAQVGLFEQACAFLTGRGFSHYEISNFALNGRECRHNLNYWRGGEYLGLGPAAASHLVGKRFRNRPDLDAYLQDPIGQIDPVETLEEDDKIAEEAMLRLRLLVEGLNARELSGRFRPASVERLVRRLDAMVGAGSLVQEGARYVLPGPRVMTSNGIFQQVLGLAAPPL